MIKNTSNDIVVVVYYENCKNKEIELIRKVNVRIRYKKVLNFLLLDLDLR